MFWAFVVACGLALAFAKLGAMSVTVRVLTFGLWGALIALGIVAIALVWRTVTRK